MILASFSDGFGTHRSGFIVDKYVVDLQSAFEDLKSTVDFSIGCFPATMLEFLRLGDIGMKTAQTISEYFLESFDSSKSYVKLVSDVTLLSPIPNPPSMRDGYAFRQHVETARRNRGLEMIPEFDEIPIFYFTNHQSVTGPGKVDVQKMHLGSLDFELEIAIVIGKEGRNISAKNADDYIAGYTIMNDWSARVLQMHEMKLNLGPAKGKDFATSLGPYLVTKDELALCKVTKNDQPGDFYNLTMKAFVNGIHVSTGNAQDMSWSFAQIIERASYGVTLYPGDVIGSGTCGTGCFLELNGSKVFDQPWWLKPGDVVECEIDLLGKLTNLINYIEV